MEPLEVVKYPDPILTRPTVEIEEIVDSTVELVEQMFAAMYQARGVGMAAPQVGSNLRLTVINLTEKEEEEEVLINPRLVAVADQEVMEEGCLSFPGLTVKISRPKWVQIQAYDLAGHERTLEAEGLMARALQHEIDHLDGVLFLSKFSEAQKLHAKSSLKQFEQQYQDRP